MDIIDTFTKKSFSEETTNNIIEHIKNEDNAALIKSLENLLGPLNLDQESLSQVIISSLPKTSAPGPQGPTQLPFQDSYVVHDPSNYIIVNGPDGEQYYTDNHGLFINVKDVKMKAAYDEKPQLSAEEVVEIIAQDALDAKEVGVKVCWNDDNTKILATVTTSEGISVESVNKKFIFEHFTLLEIDSFTLAEVCEVTYSMENIPTCLFYTAKAGQEELVPSPHYKFDRPSKFRGSCCNEMVVKESADINPSCMYDMNPKATFACANFIQSPWEDAYSATDKEDKAIVIQSRRYGLGELKWRAVDSVSNEIVATSNNKEGLDSFLESIGDSLVGVTPIKAVQQIPLTQDKVYTNHVTNSLN